MIESIILSWNYDTSLGDAIDIFEEALKKLGMHTINFEADVGTYAILVTPVIAPIS